MATGKIVKEFIVDNVTPSDAFSIANYKPRGNIMTQDELDVFVNELLEQNK